MSAEGLIRIDGLGLRRDRKGCGRWVSYGRKKGGGGGGEIWRSRSSQLVGVGGRDGAGERLQREPRWMSVESRNEFLKRSRK